MKNTFLLVPAIGLIATPVLAQDSSEPPSAAEQAAEAVATIAEEALVPPPAPAPPLSERDKYLLSRATPLNYEELRPNPADYPLDAWQAGETGYVAYVLTVDSDGKATSCDITESSGSVALDNATCAVVMRGQFDPARDEDGNPVEGTYDDSYQWRKREPEFPGTMRVSVQYTVDERGEVKDCQVLDKSGDFSESLDRSFEREPCPGINRPPRAVYRDETGVPVARRVTVTFEAKVEDMPE